MGKKNKSKKNKQKKKKSLTSNGENNLNKDEPCIPNEENENSPPKKKLSKEMLHKRKEMRRKIKRIRKKNKKKAGGVKFNVDYHYLEEIDDLFLPEDLDRLPRDKFVTYNIPTSIEENKEYIPLLISESDIILELLDARDIYHSINNQIEKLIQNNDKKLLIYVITKCDLVSEEYINKIKKYLEDKNNNKNPVIISSSLMREKIHNLFNELQTHIQSIREKNNDKNVIKIGVIGAPNVGKNSLIQSLELIVNSNCDEKYIYFNEEKNFCVNSVPGTIFDEDDNNNILISKKYKDVKEIPEPIKLINNLMDIINKDNLKDIYELNKTPENLDDFIDLVKEKYNFEDCNITICKILTDIITGKISYEVNN